MKSAGPPLCLRPPGLCSSAFRGGRFGGAQWPKPAPVQTPGLLTPEAAGFAPSGRPLPRASHGSQEPSQTSLCVHRSPPPHRPARGLQGDVFAVSFSWRKRCVRNWGNYRSLYPPPFMRPSVRILHLNAPQTDRKSQVFAGLTHLWDELEKGTPLRSPRQLPLLPFPRSRRLEIPSA